MRYRFETAGKVYEISVERRDEGFRAVVDGQAYDLEVLDSQPGRLDLRFAPAGEPGLVARSAVLYWAVDGNTRWVSLNGCTYRLEKPSPRARRIDGSSGSPAGAAIRSPMPAQVRAVQVEEGEAVEPGQTLLLLEAMKMEIRVRAPAAGNVTRLLVTAGQAVEKDQLLAEIGKEKP